ncbi:hypothetical protein vseg_016679 [Gypsophila vaccaria]
MGGAISHLIPCLNPAVDHHHAPPHHHHHAPPHHHRTTTVDGDGIVYSAEEPLDETLGHSFCYLPSSARFLSPTASDRFSFRFDEPPPPPARQARPDPVYRAISGASVSANTETSPSACAAAVEGFDCTAAFTAVPLQRGHRSSAAGSFLSGPIERGAVSGPLDSSSVTDASGRVPFSAPLSVGDGVDSNNNGSNCNISSNVGGYKKRRKNSLAGIKRSLYRSFSEKKRPWVVPGERKEVRRKLWEFLAENDAEDGLDLSGSDRFAFSVDDAVRVSNAGTGMSRRSLMLSKLKQGWSRSKDGNSKGGLFHWRFKVGEKDKADVENRVEAEEGEEAVRVCSNGRRRKTGPVDHELVLRALAQALEKTEHAYLDLTDKVIDRYPELALMGSCLLVVLMRDEDVYVMNLGDSRAIVAHFEPEESCSNVGSKGKTESSSSIDGIVEECTARGEETGSVSHECSSKAMKLTALQLSTDHSTSIVEEVQRIKKEHPDDNHCIVNDRVKGRLKVTRAFGAGFLKQAKFNDSLLEMFRNEFIGAAPYVSCIPSLCHHQLGPRDHFLVLSSDGLNQYLTNQEVVSFVENFMEKYPDGDPAQHLIEELLNRAAKKAGMDFHDLLDIPQGDRRKYHDDVTVMVISLEGRIWKSSGKYP